MAKADKNWKNKIERSFDDGIDNSVIRRPVADLRIGDKIGKTKITHIEECPMNWRTHIHVNKKDCYDTRAYVLVKS